MCKDLVAAARFAQEVIEVLVKLQELGFALAWFDPNHTNPVRFDWHPIKLDLFGELLLVRRPATLPDPGASPLRGTWRRLGREDIPRPIFRQGRLQQPFFRDCDYRA